MCICYRTILQCNQAIVKLNVNYATLCTVGLMARLCRWITGEMPLSLFSLPVTICVQCRCKATPGMYSRTKPKSLFNSLRTVCVCVCVCGRGSARFILKYFVDGRTFCSVMHYMQ